MRKLSAIVMATTLALGAANLAHAADTATTAAQPGTTTTATQPGAAPTAAQRKCDAVSQRGAGDAS